MTVPTSHKFPPDPVLVRLLDAAKQYSTSKNIILDDYGFEKTYDQLFGDILKTRELIRNNLPPSTLNDDGLLQQQVPYICVLALSGYEFLVAFFAARALGGACIPFSSGILPEEAFYFLSNAKSSVLLSGQGREEQVAKIAEYARGHGDQDIATPAVSCEASAISCANVEIDDSLQIDPAGPGLVLFTSGTTGPPKGAVLPKLFAEFPEIDEHNSGSINYRPPHWIGGAEALIKSLVTGRQLHAVKERAGAKEIWEIFKEHRITNVLFTPTLLRTMKEYYTEHIIRLPNDEREKYLTGFKNLGHFRCASAMIAPSVVRFWVELTGIPFMNVYGSTELGGAAIQASTDTKIKQSIGRACPGVKVKLSEGEQGEIRCQHPWMLTHYIGNEAATKAAFDEGGYFKTGDLARLVEGEYVFTGRATADYVFFHGYRIASLRVENCLTDLPYVAEAYIIGVPDHEAKELCGALVRLEKGVSSSEVTLAKIREDISATLPTYMLPTLLRIMKDGEEIPRTTSQKPIKKRILKEIFGIEGYWSAEDPVPGVESWGNQPVQVEAQTRAWDWCGLQRSD